MIIKDFKKSATVKGVLIWVFVVLILGSCIALTLPRNIEEDKVAQNNTAATTTIISTTQVKTTVKQAKTKQQTTKTITTKQYIPTSEHTTQAQTEPECLYSASYFRNQGVLYYNNWTWKYYSEKVLPGEGLNIPGRHSDSNGYICDENNYICLASAVLSKGTVVKTPLGKYGKVYDDGCSSDVLDVYVNW